MDYRDLTNFFHEHYKLHTQKLFHKIKKTQIQGKGCLSKKIKKKISNLLLIFSLNHITIHPKSTKYQLINQRHKTKHGIT